MALATLPLVTFVDQQFGNVDVILEYDNSLMQATRVLCNNPTPNNCRVTLTRDSDGASVSRTFGPGNTSVSIPQGASTRFPLTLNSRGNLDGYSCSGTYPA